MWRHIASNALTMLIVAVFLVGGLILWGQNEYSAQGPLDEQICLRVERGSNVGIVSENLEKQGAISSGMLLRIGMDYTDLAGQLKAGSYLVPPKSSPKEIADIITRGGASTCGTEIVYRIGVTQLSNLVRELDPATSEYIEKAKFDPATEEAPAEYIAVRERPDTRVRIAIAEGVTSWQIVEGLKRISLLEGEIAEVPAEGSLAPQSYEVRKGDKREELLVEMAARQERILAEAWENRVDGLPVNSPEEALILASLIEKETGVAEERRQVASVFVNRLRQGMKLQTDPTVIYGITNGQGVLGRGLRRSELRAETPYNTYVIDALPPTPIANPGRASIEAALDPDSTDYIFFVADGTGGHAFAVTLDEHNANVARWREIEAERATD
ncbi:endolytic transglycosylase MltG [Lentibacter sp. XHP0401]|uniref:endolytic transglycosylase MltG n=1 Tax=Lentibacter sp. XHP0401 TaxID=2984334 RepID=UPI0021E80B4B|nr:endolytic transglycosylase MltG [Lentibacter sp. XHP0401]MCV2891917.1 endolytic transglycosylase MltG [Lentibacter sp. XHP0401]